MANILVLNAGSGSQKVALYAIHSDSEAPSAPLWQAETNSTTPGQPEGRLVAQMTSVRGKAEVLSPRDSPLTSQMLISASSEGASAVLERREQIDLIDHRVFTVVWSSAAPPWSIRRLNRPLPNWENIGRPNDDNLWQILSQSTVRACGSLGAAGIPGRLIVAHKVDSIRVTCKSA